MAPEDRESKHKSLTMLELQVFILARGWFIFLCDNLVNCCELLVIYQAMVTKELVRW